MGRNCKMKILSKQVDLFREISCRSSSRHWEHSRNFIVTRLILFSTHAPCQSAFRFAFQGALVFGALNKKTYFTLFPPIK